ncbi:MAG: hydroxymethylbilane synthase [Candidatus Pelagibacter sp.]|nr:hydroxymethylbilane synthase [Candidatus Pelagibacter sp.]OUT95733.1 MAG: hydroxymethylbilane synthase [Gammaproteobacteria bacterium TMED36]|tara:strand:+ start:3547 stop:4482 length:936 start_codon:yes stop_codon:yes gene_type:complete
MFKNKKIKIGSRGSKLSLAYSNHVKNFLLNSEPNLNKDSIEIKIIKTSGDIFQNKQISQIGGKGVFSKEIEEQLLNSKIDLAVHSLKDLPSKMTKDLCVNSIVKRNDPRDAFVSYSSESFFKLKPNSKVGTSSFRRAAQLKTLRQDINIIPIRGNIDTRINKLKNKEFDAIVLAVAGLQVLNIKNEAKEIFSIDQMLPAVGQGAIAIQTRKNNFKILDLIKKINHEETFICVNAERALLEAIGGDCDTAVGAIGTIKKNKIFLRSELFSNDGSEKFIAEGSGNFNEAQEIGYRVGKDLLKKAGSKFKVIGS